MSDNKLFCSYEQKNSKSDFYRPLLVKIQNEGEERIKTDLLKMASLEKKAQCVLGYVMLFWGYVKDVVYRTKVHNVVELKQRIESATEQVD
ncbi:hypothetical protein AVEN_14208-1 [Araneus ventricosus]|uniref:Uncharacterized protein n=1 Tax=Araneus ventricosus TaxID=182803 RepID=A0A4Y2SMI7_ARAVE|nr:hypothetical protein AVEN_158679-1 [Araneus ventricosus]GBN89489.1 hypothetical protein AVEN_270172-1 [Araneus ventricosus]GBN89494.1 hypothetical protein AVEN_14208-1 [Araneus ventricosus]